MLNLAAAAAGLKKYLVSDSINPKPKEVTDFNYDKSTREERLDWEDWAVGDAKTMLVLSWNMSEALAKVIQDKKTAAESWKALQDTVHMEAVEELRYTQLWSIDVR